MGFGDIATDDSSNDNENSGGSVSYIYIREDDNLDAYNLMSDKGSAYVRNYLKATVPDEIATDQHDFFQQMVVALEPAFKDDDYNDLLEFLMVDAGNIADYLDENDEVREELIEMLAQTKEMQEAIEASD